MSRQDTFGTIELVELSALCMSELWEGGGFHEGNNSGLACHGTYLLKDHALSGADPITIGVCPCKCHAKNNAITSRVDAAIQAALRKENEKLDSQRRQQALSKVPQPTARKRKKALCRVPQKSRAGKQKQEKVKHGL